MCTGQLYTWRHALRAWGQPDAAFGRFARVEVAPQPGSFHIMQLGRSCLLVARPAAPASPMVTGRDCFRGHGLDDGDKPGPVPDSGQHTQQQDWDADPGEEPGGTRRDHARATETVAMRLPPLASHRCVGGKLALQLHFSAVLQPRRIQENRRLDLPRLFRPLWQRVTQSAVPFIPTRL